MATFHAKIGWKRMWKRENKNFRSYPMPNVKTPNQLAKKLKKLKNTSMASF